jgi:C1A family cysteine protease
MQLLDRLQYCTLKHEHIANPNFASFPLTTSSSTGSPAVVDLRSKLPSVWDQGNVGSCTAFALCACFSICDKTFDASKMFLYYNERYLDSLQGDNAPSIDDGSTISQGISALLKYGVCSTSKWPYLSSLVGTKPTAPCYTEALTHQALQVMNVRQDLAQCKACLQAGFPFALGIVIFDSFSLDTQNKIPLPNKRTEKILGGHAICVVGYDDNKQCFLVRNSWGSNWGMNGHFYIPYAYITDPTIAGDLWKITQVEVVPPPAPTPPAPPAPTPPAPPAPQPRRVTPPRPPRRVIPPPRPRRVVRNAQSTTRSVMLMDMGGRAVLK